MAPTQRSSAVLLINLSCISSLVLLLPGASAAFYDISEYAEVFSPLGARQSEAPTTLGQPFSYNNDLREGSDKSATIGFVNGNCLVSAQITDGNPDTLYQCFETLVFRSGTYAGSSLTAVGYYDFIENGPLAIVGGTGMFRGATGELNYVLPADVSTYSIPTLLFVTPDFPASPTSTSPPATTCIAGSDNPNQCFNTDGSSFVCCAGGCGLSAATATCV